MSKQPTVYSLKEEEALNMSPAQRVVIRDMIANHARIQFFIEDFVPRSNPLVDMRLKLMGISRSEMWMPIVDALAKMSPTKFDQLLVELHHYTVKGIEANSAGASTDLVPEPV